MKLNHIGFPMQKKTAVIFIDASLDNYQALRNNINIDASIFVLHPEVDGVKQITQTLSEFRHIQNIHLVSHGEPGTLYLGNTELNLDTLESYSEDIKSWFNLIDLQSAPVLNIYACNVAATNTGNQFLEQLRQLTGASIYASSTPVGSSNLGGNWELDVCYGENVSREHLLFNPEVLATYAGVFATGNNDKYTFYDSNEQGSKGTATFNNISSNGTQLSGFNNDQQVEVSSRISHK